MNRNKITSFLSLIILITALSSLMACDLNESNDIELISSIASSSDGIELISSLTSSSDGTERKSSIASSSDGKDINGSSVVLVHKMKFEFELENHWVYEKIERSDSKELLYHLYDTITIVDKYKLEDSLYYVRNVIRSVVETNISGLRLGENSFQDTLIMLDGVVHSSPNWIRSTDFFSQLNKEINWGFNSYAMIFESRESFENSDDESWSIVLDTNNTDIFIKGETFDKYRGGGWFEGEYSNIFGLLKGEFVGAGWTKGKDEQIYYGSNVYYNLIDVNFLKAEFLATKMKEDDL